VTTIAPPTDRRVNVNISIPLKELHLKQRVILYLLTLRSAIAIVLSPPKGILSRLLEIPLTTLGVAGIDFSAFHVSHGFGWLITGISLIVLEYMIAVDSD
jgi:hypothetical protein